MSDPELQTRLHSLFTEISNGNAQAYEWLVLWNQHIHRLDDIIDEPGEYNSDQIIEAFAKAQGVVIHPFFVENKATLWPIILLAANAYSDSNNYLNDHEAVEIWTKQVGDVLRSYGNEVMIVVAGICAVNDSFQRMRALSHKIRELSWRIHHDSKGRSI